MAKIEVKEIGKLLQLIDSLNKYRSDSTKEYIGEENLIQLVCLNNNRTVKR